jgi:hypothetical protein
MKYPINILKDDLESLECAYEEFVVKTNKVDKNSDEAIINRLKVKNLKEAIKKLEKDAKKE